MLRTLLFTAAGVLLPFQDPEATFDGGATVLSIDGAEITADEYARWLIETGASRFGREFADRWAVLREARARGVVVPEAEVAKILDDQIERRITHAFLGDKAGWLDELQRAERSEPGYRNQMLMDTRPRLECKAMVAENRVVPEDKLVRDWELDFGPRGRDMSLTMIKFQVEVLTPEQGAPPGELERGRAEAWAEKRAIALEVRERALAGEDFSALASRFSEDTETRQNGGRLPNFRGGGWPRSFIDALLELEVGQVSEPLQARGGWWLVRLDELHETPLEEARPTVEAKLLARGPEQDEVGNLWNEITEDVYFELQPALFGEGPVDPEGGEPVGMLIDGEEIPVRVVADWLMKIRGEWQARYFTEYWLVMKKARELGVEISDEQVDARVERYLDWMLATNPSYKGSREAWVTHLSLSGRRVEDFLREVRYRMHLDSVVEELILREREVTEEMVRAEFERQFGADGRWIEVRMIQIDVDVPEVPRDLTREELDQVLSDAVDATGAYAAGIVERLAGGEDFAAIARAESDEPISAAAGGRLEGRFRPDAWSDEVGAAVSALAVGQVTAPLFETRSFLVFEVIEQRTVAFEEARAELEAELRDRQPSQGDLSAYRNVISRETEIAVLPAMYE